MPRVRRPASLAPIAALACSLVLACSDGGRDSADDSAASNPTGVPPATTTATTGTIDPTTSGATEAISDAGTATTADTASGSGDTQPGDTTSVPDTGDSADVTSTGPVDPGDSTVFGSETTFDSFGDTTAGPPECKQQIDVVFVMDVSTSMLGILQKLEDEILTVDAKLKSLDVMPDVNYGLVVFVDDTQIINGGAPYADVQLLKQDFNKWWKFTQSNSQVNGGGSNGDWPENSIDALFTAANAFQWRPSEDTLRMVIHCTDDTFGEQGAVQSGIAIQHTYDETVTSFQDRQVRVFAFADKDNTGGPGNNEDVSMGFFTPYKGKTPIPDATDGGAFNINLVNANQLSLSAAINESVEQSLCKQYIPQ